MCKMGRLNLCTMVDEGKCPSYCVDFHGISALLKPKSISDCNRTSTSQGTNFRIENILENSCRLF